jgi:ABC-type lipoprotein release transport system permease subunit
MKKIMMPPPPGSNNSYPLAFNHIWIESIIICISLIIIALISSIKPSLDAGKLKIADALRA